MVNSYILNNRKTGTSIPNHSIKQYLKNCTQKTTKSTKQSIDIY